VEMRRAMIIGVHADADGTEALQNGHRSLCENIVQ
jgi:hypothetical protein